MQEEPLCQPQFAGRHPGDRDGDVSPGDRAFWSSRWHPVGRRIKRDARWQRHRHAVAVPGMHDQPGVAAGNMGRELGTRAKAKLKVAGQNPLVSAYGQL
jgi:hypothetical protein